MVPTAILLGLVLGRWWAVPLALVLWPALVMAFGDRLSAPGMAEAALLGSINAAAGVLVHRVAVATVRRAFGRLRA